MACVYKASAEEVATEESLGLSGSQLKPNKQAPGLAGDPVSKTLVETDGGRCLTLTSGLRKYTHANLHRYHTEDKGTHREKTPVKTCVPSTRETISQPDPSPNYFQKQHL